MHVLFCVSKNVSVSCAYTQGKREQFSGFNRTLDAINNVFRKFSAFHDETGRLNVDGMNIISNRSEERFSRNAETDLVCRLLLEKKTASSRCPRPPPPSPPTPSHLSFLPPSTPPRLYPLSRHDALPIFLRVHAR